MSAGRNVKGNSRKANRIWCGVILGLRPRPAALRRIGRSPARTCAGTFFEFLAYPYAFILGCALAVAAGAQQYPDRPVRMIVGFPPGGAADILGRMAAQQLSETLGHNVVVDNRGGAGGLIATEIAAKAHPDGYTLLFTSIPHVINPHLYRKVAYDAVKDFAPVGQLVSVPLMMAANGGQVNVTIASAVPLSPHVKSGKLRGLGVTSPKRSPSFLDLPAIAETVPGYEVINWFGILVPAGTSNAIVARINKDLNAALASPDLKNRLAAQGADIAGGTPEEFARRIRSDLAKWERVVRESGARVE